MSEFYSGTWMTEVYDCGCVSFLDTRKGLLDMHHLLDRAIMLLLDAKEIRTYSLNQKMMNVSVRYNSGKVVSQEKNRGVKIGIKFTRKQSQIKYTERKKYILTIV